MLEKDFCDRVLPYDVTAALYYATRVSAARSNGITVGHGDGRIDAIVAARDTAPFKAIESTRSIPGNMGHKMSLPYQASNTQQTDIFADDRHSTDRSEASRPLS